MVDWLLPDAKSQVTVKYVDGKPEFIDTIVVSTQHAKTIHQSQIKDFIKKRVIQNGDIIPQKSFEAGLHTSC